VVNEPGPMEEEEVGNFTPPRTRTNLEKQIINQYKNIANNFIQRVNSNKTLQNAFNRLSSSMDEQRANTVKAQVISILGSMTTEPSTSNTNKLNRALTLVRSFQP